MKKLLVCGACFFLMGTVAKASLEEPDRDAKPLGCAATQTKKASHDFAPQDTDQMRLMAVSSREALFGQWFNLTLGVTARERGFEVLGEMALGRAVAWHNSNKYDSLPPYMPLQHAFLAHDLKRLAQQVMGGEKKVVAYVLHELLDQVPGGHAMQIMLYPTTWERTYRLIPVILHRPAAPHDPTLSDTAFLEMYSEHALNALSRSLDHLVTGQQMLDLMHEIPRRTLHYVGQFLWFQPHAVPRLPMRNTVMLRFLSVLEVTPLTEWLRGQGFVSFGNDQEALKVWKAQYDAGNPHAALSWANLVYKKNLAVEEGEVPRALRFAASKGLPLAQLQMGDYLATKMDTPDYKSARIYWERAMRQGNGFAMMRLGRTFESGLGGDVDLVAARKMYERAGRKGVKGGFYHAGLVAARMNTEADDKRARLLFHGELLANPKHRDAANHLAVLYAMGRGGAKDLDFAIHLTLRHAKHPTEPEGRSCHNVGAILLLKHNAECDKDARRFFEEGSRLNDGPSAYQYALMCKDGRGGKVDLEMAMVYAQKAQELGNLRAVELITSIQGALAKKGARKKKVIWTRSPEKQPLLY